MWERDFVEATPSRVTASEVVRVTDDQVERPRPAANLGEAVARLPDVEGDRILGFRNEVLYSWFTFAREIDA